MACNITLLSQPTQGATFTGELPMINAITKNPYTGQNADLCLRAMDAFGFHSNKFATFKQWQQLGRSVKGAKGKGLHLTTYVKKTVTLPNGVKTQKTVPVSFCVFNEDLTQPLH